MRQVMIRKQMQAERTKPFTDEQAKLDAEWKAASERDWVSRHDLP